MAKSMPEVEKRARSLLRFVSDDDTSLGRAADRDRFGPRWSTSEHVPPIRFQKFKKATVANEPILDDLSKAGAKIALAEGIEARDVGEHQRRLMKSADEVLSVSRIDSSLAAHAGVDLSEQCRWDLHQAQAPAHCRSAESGEIADDPPAKRNDNVSTLDARLDQRIGDAGELDIRLGALARRADDRCGAQTRLTQACGEPIKVERRDPGVGHYGAIDARRNPVDFGTRLVENACPNQDRIRARPKRNFHLASRLRQGSSVIAKRRVEAPEDGVDNRIVGGVNQFDGEIGERIGR